MTASTDSKISISISDAFDGGNIEFIEQRPNETDPTTTIDVILHIKPDVYTQLEKIAHMQYFSYRATVSGISSGSSQKINYILANASKCSYPEAWTGSTVFYSKDVTDADSWKRNRDTFYTQGQLSWVQEHVEDGSMYFSYFPPYSYDRHVSFLAKCTEAISSKPDARVFSLGQSLEGRELDCIQVGTGGLKCWIIHRQHPGESMAEHYAEGLLTRLLGLNGHAVDEEASRALSLYTFYIVPCMCPDGAVRGHLRTNAVGANLNREWTTKGDYVAPTLERSPEVFWTLAQMDKTGVDCFVDVHGDEELPYNFLSGSNCIPKWSTRLESLHGAFCAAYSRTNSDMQQQFGYPPSERTADVLPYMNVATNQVSNRFECLAVTLEMPFKDCQSNPDPDFGWNPKRSRELGASVVDALLYVQPFLRADSDFWMSTLSADDAYVVTTNDYQGNGDGADANDLDDGFKMMKKRFYSDVHEIRKVQQ